MSRSENATATAPRTRKRFWNVPNSLTVSRLVLAVAVYALATKVFPASLDPGDPLGRLRAPFGYWNAVGVVAAMGLPACLWLGAAPESPRALRVISPPGIGLLLAVLLMSYSRGALAIAVIGVAIWFAVVPLRIRGAAVLALGAGGAAVIAGWALPIHRLSDDNVALALRTGAGHTLGVVVAVVVLVSLAAAAAMTAAMDRVELRAEQRRRIGIGLLACAALIPAGAVAALAASPRGLTGEISHAWDTLTNPNGAVGDHPSRLLNLSNTRTRYWSEGLTVGEHHLLTGSGALGFAVAHQRYSHSPFPISHAHDFLIETFADLGLTGVLIAVALLLAWTAAAGRAIGLERARGGRLRLRAPPPGSRSAERGALLTLLVVVVIFGLHNLIDWTWFVPGAAVPALACAGWLAGRGPLGAPVGRAAGPRRLRRSPGAGMAIIAIAAIVLTLAWTIVQPLRATDLDSSAVGAIVRGDSALALTDAHRAASADPLSLDPLYLLSAIYTARCQPGQARDELLAAVRLQPENPSPWQALARLDLARHNLPAALAELRRALTLDPLSQTTAQLMAQARTGAATPATPQPCPAP